MARKKQNYITGKFTHRRTEGEYMRVLLDAVSLEDWEEVVRAAVSAAKDGDPSARIWLAQYLMGRPVALAPAPLTVVVQQLSGNDPLVDKLARPHIEKGEYPALYGGESFKEAVKGRVADELRALEVGDPSARESSENTNNTRI